MRGYVFLALSDIRMSKKMLKRLSTKSHQLRAQELTGDEYPIQVSRLEDGTYRILDGRHRVMAASLSGEEYILAEIVSSSSQRL